MKLGMRKKLFCTAMTLLMTLLAGSVALADVKPFGPSPIGSVKSEEISSYGVLIQKEVVYPEWMGKNAKLENNPYSFEIIGKNDTNKVVL